MSENLFEIRKNDRRMKIIEENLDVADQILSTNPNANILQSENMIEESQPEEESVTEVEVSEVFAPEESDKLTPLNLSEFKKKDSGKNRYTYYLDDEVDKLLIAISNKFEMKSKSVLANFLLGSTLLMNEDIQLLIHNDKEIATHYKKLFEKFKEK